MTTAYLLEDLEADEGLRLVAYPDPDSPLAKACKHLGLDLVDYDRVPGWKAISGAPWTIGYGHTGKEVAPGLTWTEDQAENALKTDILAVKSQLDALYPWWRALSDVRQDVLANMTFNIGIGSLRGFKNMLWALRKGDFPTAAAEMENSDWAREVPKRAERLINQMKSDTRLPLAA